ncbi:TetR/AcrR family transcriptional regulator [Mycolicibacterium stellerae]|uniref:TetR/AcrR family transcriptional regulator n=1 Tax=Mycolicibacterium stellerae TaxID=2358193 RepID=UPI000F0BD1BB|nr:TetR/AcrR family transcriptional regulator [Mycolicibacterium stellerae]
MPAPHTSTQDERSEAARKLIIDAAIKLLAEEGYQRTTFTRIQDCAGVSRGLITYHFGSKAKLIEAVIASTRDTFSAEALEPLKEAATGLDAILGMITSYFDRLTVNPKPAAVMLVLAVSADADAAEVKAAVSQRYAEMRQELYDWIERGRADGSVASSIEPVSYAALLEGVIRGVALQYLVDPGTFDIRGARDAAVRMVTAALAGSG